VGNWDDNRPPAPKCRQSARSRAAIPARSLGDGLKLGMNSKQRYALTNGLNLFGDVDHSAPAFTNFLQQLVTTVVCPMAFSGVLAESDFIVACADSVSVTSSVSGC